MNSTLRLHGTYYITKQIIPVLSRVFNLVGAGIVNGSPILLLPIRCDNIGIIFSYVDLESWFKEMPKVQRAIQFTASQLHAEVPRGGHQGAGRTIDQYYVAKHCLVCHELTYDGKNIAIID